MRIEGVGQQGDANHDVDETQRRIEIAFESHSFITLLKPKSFDSSAAADSLRMTF